MLVEQSGEMPRPDSKRFREHFNRRIIESARIDQSNRAFDGRP